jgi:hypothetical protein
MAGVWPASELSRFAPTVGTGVAIVYHAAVGASTIRNALTFDADGAQ